MRCWRLLLHVELSEHLGVARRVTGCGRQKRKRSCRRSCGDNIASTFQDHQSAGGFQVNVMLPGPRLGGNLAEARFSYKRRRFTELRRPRQAKAREGTPKDEAANRGGLIFHLLVSPNQFGQHFFLSGPRWYPGGQALPSNIGWHLPPGPRHHPAPHPSATLITELSALPIGAGVTAALATVARPKANAVLKKTVLIMRSSFIDRKDHSSFAVFFHRWI